MPRYFIDVDDGDRRVTDEVGLELPDVQAARARAVVVLPEIAREKLPCGNHRIFMTIVRDERGSVLCRAMLSLTVVNVSALTGPDAHTTRRPEPAPP